MGICDGRVVIVTGSGRGIGREHALAFAREGAKVVVNDLGGDMRGDGGSLSPAMEVVEEIKAMGGEAVADGENVADFAGAGRMVQKAIDTFGCKFWQAYGLTETTGTVVNLPPEDHDPGGPNTHRLRSCGVPGPGVELRIVDVGSGQDVPAGEVGEIWVRSPQVMKGYWNLPEASAEAITEDGWFRTGDAGYLDEDGYLYIHDRVKDMIVSGGENVYPAEVENVLAAHPCVADVAVIGVPDERYGEAVKAVVVLRPGAEAAAPELIEFCRDKIAGYKRPRSVDFAEALPRNPTGKVLRRELREPYWKGHTRRVH